jgi:hypothetical protein
MAAQAPTRSELEPIRAAGVEQCPREGFKAPTPDPGPPDAEPKDPQVERHGSRGLIGECKFLV